MLVITLFLHMILYICILLVFNIENKVDLTDRGRAEARKKKRQEREARGELRTPKDPNADPYRYLRILTSYTDLYAQLARTLVLWLIVLRICSVLDLYAVYMLINCIRMNILVYTYIGTSGSRTMTGTISTS